MEKRDVEKGTGGETLYRNKIRLLFLLSAGVSLIILPAVAVLGRYYPVPSLVFVIIVLVMGADIGVIYYLLGRRPDILISPNYFGFIRFFATYRVRWDRVNRVSIDDGSGTITVAFRNEKSENEIISFNIGDYPGATDLESELKRYSQGGISQR